MTRMAGRLSTWGMEAMIKAAAPGVDELQGAAYGDFVAKYTVRATSPLPQCLCPPSRIWRTAGSLGFLLGAGGV